MIELTPTHYELTDESGELVAKIKMFDECASTIKIKTVVSANSWPELSDAILKALKHMHPEKQA